ncbi:MAG: VWA domain-containing protein, partial [Chloroflexota bacterium]|nr:VWA domain-containing protein [Chloroflexota bacterium]
MRRAAVSAAVLGLLALGAPAAPASAQDQVSLTPASAKPFPHRSFRLAAPGRRGLRTEDVKVTENGDAVSALSLSSVDGGRPGEFGAILVIDASSSMRGRAIRSAIDAARALARQRRGAQQLGVIVFNSTVKVLLAPTSDQRAINDALSGPPSLGPRTHTFDAVSSALDELERAAITAGSIVVLSDGRDTGSVARADAVARRARKANISIFTVGLRSGSINSKRINSRELEDLAAARRGR